MPGTSVSTFGLKQHKTTTFFPVGPVRGKIGREVPCYKTGWNGSGLSIPIVSGSDFAPWQGRKTQDEYQGLRFAIDLLHLTPASKTLRPLVIGGPDLFWDDEIDFWRFRQLCIIAEVKTEIEWT